MTERRLGVILCLFTCMAFVFGLPGCSSEGDNPVIESTYMNIPRVTGLVFTDPSGATIGGWGVLPPTSYSGGGLPTNFSVEVYPNPFDIATNAVFQVPVHSHIRIRVTRALGPNETQEELADYLGGELVTAPGIPLWRADDTSEAGEHTFTIDTKSWPDGFYCIYFQANDYYFQQRFVVKGELPDDFYR